MNFSSFKQFLESLEVNTDNPNDVMIDDSINDKGRFKAVFVTGIPGSGKSYTADKLAGAVQPAVVNIDRATEFWAKKIDTPSTPDNWQSLFQDTATRITLNALYHQLNGIRPLFIDGTSNNFAAIKNRTEILRELGYDVGMIFVNTDKELARSRAKARAAELRREVDDKFIDEVHAKSLENMEKFKTLFPDFYRVTNNDRDRFDNTTLENLFSKTEQFFLKPLQNEVGIARVREMQEKKQSYLTPEIMSETELKQKVQAWYAYH